MLESNYLFFSKLSQLKFYFTFTFKRWVDKCVICGTKETLMLTLWVSRLTYRWEGGEKVSFGDNMRI